MCLAHEHHGAGRRAGDETAFEIARRELAGIDDMQAVDVLFRKDRLDDRLGVQVLRQRQLHEDAVNGGIRIELRNQRGEFFLRGCLRQGVLDRQEAALLGHLALRGNIGVACRIVADDHDGKACANTGIRLERLGRGLHSLDDRSGDFLAINHSRHGMFLLASCSRGTL
ncbi:hypothetical protein D9M72_377520 [compost metagenome]